MNETTVTVVGNVLNPPECRRLLESQTLVTHFKVAANTRRYDRTGERWIDGDSLRVRVNCWRQLAENVARSVNVGDPVIITGRLFSRDWESSDHVKRISYELDATSVGHDLARGRAKFSRIKPNTGTSAIDDELTDARIGEEPTTPATEINGLPRRRVWDPELGGYAVQVEERDPFADEVLAELDAALDGTASFDQDPISTTEDDGDLERELAEVTARAAASASPASPASPDDEESSEADETETETETTTTPAPAGRRGSRSAGRVPAGV